VIVQDAVALRTREQRYPERRGVSRRPVIKAAKQAVSTIDLADRLCGPGQLRKVGSQWAALCPLPDHQERTPSFTVDRAKDVWFCHGCLRGGDVIELARFAWGYEKHEAVTAAAELLHEFGHPILERPANWFAKQARQKPARAAIEAAKVRHAQRRVFRIFLPMLKEMEDEDERRAEAECLWDAAQEIGALIVGGRSS
jgi:hypothetical protein